MKASLRGRILLAGVLSVVGLYLAWDYRRTQEEGRAGRPAEGPPASPSAPRLDPARPTVLEAAPPRVGTAGEGRIDARFRTAEEHAPIPEAEAFLVPATVFAEAVGDRFGRPGRSALEETVARVGERLAVDAEGRARFAPPATPSLLVAWTDARWAMVAVSPRDTGERAVELAPAPALRVRVLDADGRPAGGVPVALRWKEEFAILDLAVVSSASETGVAVVPHVIARLDEHVTEELEGGDGVLVAALSICAPAPAEAPVDPHALPAAPLDLVLPRTGELEVRLRGVVPNPAAPPWVVLRPVPGADRPSGGGPALPPAGAGVGSADGVVLFPRVALGLDIDVQVWTEGRPPVTVRARGPREEGERVTVEVRLDTRPSDLPR